MRNSVLERSFAVGPVEGRPRTATCGEFVRHARSPYSVVMPPIPPPRQSGFTSTTPIPLYWCSYGPEGAPRLLVLHGGPGAHHDYLLPQMLRLAEQYDLLFYDQRGGGRSRTDDRTPITWETQVDDLRLLIDEFRLESPGIVGYSWGAMLALLYARAAAGIGPVTPFTAGHGLPPAPSRLVLLDPAPVNREFRRQFEEEFARRQRSPEIQRMREELAASGLRERDPEAHRQRLFELSVAGYFANPSRAASLTPFRVTGRVQDSIWASLGDFDLLADLPAIRCPSLIVHGREDPIPLESSSSAAGRLGAQLVVLDDCGHVPYVEQPGALFRAVTGFLDH